MTARRIEYMPLDKIEPADRNAKGHDTGLIGASMSRFGFLEPAILDERTGRIIAGHGRRERLIEKRDAGEDPPEGVRVRGKQWLVPVVRGWASADDAEAEAAGIALNQATIAGGWIDDLLAPMLTDLVATDHGLDGIGFDQHDLDDILSRLEMAKPESKVDDVIAVLPTKPVTKRGDVWQLGPHRVLCGDCRDAADVERVLDGAAINVAFTSPPYASQRDYDETSGFLPIPPNEYVEWFAPVAANVAAHLADDGSWFVNIKPPADGLDTDLYVFDLVIAHVREWGWHFATEFCWERVGVPKAVTRRFKNQFEPIYQFARGEWKMRPAAVRTPSDDVPISLGHGDTSWDTKQGTRLVIDPERRPKRDPNRTQASKVQGIPGGPNVAKLPRQGGDKSFVRLTKKDGTTSPSPRQLRPRKNGRRGGSPVDEREQGVGAGQMAPGEYMASGFAFPGNRLPTFSGTHEATGHSAAFPVGLPAWFVRAYTDEGDVIFDPFMGSGSTLLAAHQHDRVGYGIEISPAYCDVIAGRWQRASGEVPILTRPGRPDRQVDLTT